MNPLNFFKCLADETRLKIMLLLAREQELCVCELQEALDAIQPKVSRHLAQLKKCGLIQDRRQGQWIYYRLEANLPLWCREILQQALDANQPFLQQACCDRRPQNHSEGH